MLGRDTKYGYDELERKLNASIERVQNQVTSVETTIGSLQNTVAQINPINYSEIKCNLLKIKTVNATIINGITESSRFPLFLSNQTKKEFEMTENIIPLRQKTIKNCAVEDCENKSTIKGLCRKHYSRQYIAACPMCKIPECLNNATSADTLCGTHYLRLKTHGNVNTVLTNRGIGKTFEERFWSKVQKHANKKGCWEWQGCKDQNGYGIIGHKSATLRKAHRFAFYLVTSKIPDGFLLHVVCDNPSCVNPEHLKEGTQTENIADMVGKGRQSKGETNGNNKLTENKVLEIRNLLSQGEKGRNLAKRYGVNDSCISAIKLRHKWKHI